MSRKKQGWEESPVGLSAGEAGEHGNEGVNEGVHCLHGFSGTFWPQVKKKKKKVLLVSRNLRWVTQCGTQNLFRWTWKSGVSVASLDRAADFVP